MTKILLIEDDQSLAEVTAFNISSLGYEVQVIHDGQQAWQALNNNPYDLVIMDLMLPGLTGLEICTRLREINTQVPVLMLTSLGNEEDRVKGLETGADDYLSKPFGIRELQARVKALLRRSQGQPTSNNKEVLSSNPQTLISGSLSIKKDERQVLWQEQEIVLTAREFDLLYFLASHENQVFSRDHLLEQVWGYQFSGYEHTVNTHINRLRKKLDGAECIKTLWGVGYKYVVAQ